MKPTGIIFCPQRSLTQFLLLLSRGIMTIVQLEDGLHQ